MSASDRELARLVAAHRRVRRPDPDLRAQVADAVAADARRERMRQLAGSTAVAVGLAAAALLLMYFARGMMMTEQDSDPRRDQAVYGERDDANARAAAEREASKRGEGPRSRTSSAVDETPPEVETAPVAPAPAHVAGQLPATDVEEPQRGDAPSPDATPESPKSNPPASPAAPRDDGTREVKLLRNAEVALASDPARALELLREHAAAFRDSSLAEEREALFILALCKTGAFERALPRQAAFLRQHPQSPYAARIRSACARHEKDPPQ